MANLEVLEKYRAVFNSTAAVLLAGVAFSGCGLNWKPSDPKGLPAGSEYIGTREDVIAKGWDPGPGYREIMGDVRVWRTSRQGFYSAKCAKEEELGYEMAYEEAWPRFTLKNRPSVDSDDVPEVVYVWCRPKDEGEKLL